MDEVRTHVTPGGGRLRVEMLAVAPIGVFWKIWSVTSSNGDAEAIADGVAPGLAEARDAAAAFCAEVDASEREVLKVLDEYSHNDVTPETIRQIADRIKPILDAI